MRGVVHANRVSGLGSLGMHGDGIVGRDKEKQSGHAHETPWFSHVQKFNEGTEISAAGGF
jgi:hypothetical protein